MKISLYTVPLFLIIMARGYKTEEIRQKLIELFQDSSDGMSGVEISEKIGVNRITMSKYLNVLAAEGFLRQKNIGNVILWFLEPGQEAYDFPADYYKITQKFLKALENGDENQSYFLIKNCLNSGASILKLISEVIFPSVRSIEQLYDDGKIGNSEKQYINHIVLKALEIIDQIPVDSNPKKNILIISSDSQNTLLSHMASSYLYSSGWRIFPLGDMSSSINVLFDLDLQKFLGKIWRKKTGVMVVLVFSKTEAGLTFFAGSINSIKEKFGNRLKLGLCCNFEKKSKIKSDFQSDNFEDIMRWVQSVPEN